MSAVDALVELLELDDPFAENGEDVARLRLAAAGERFEEHRKRIGVLDRRAGDTGIDEIRSRADLVPLLFSHTTYKSYPESLIRNGQWERMTKWLTTLSAVEGDTIDLRDVSSVEEWLDRLADAGHFVMASFGTSGKNSFIDHTAEDIDRVNYAVLRYSTWPRPINFDNSWVVISLSRAAEGGGRHRGYYNHLGRIKYLARPGESYCLDEPMSFSELSQIAALRSAIAAGTAVPSDVQQFEKIRAEGEARLRQSVARLTDVVLSHRDEPMMVLGLFPFAWQMVERGRELGVAAANPHPDSVISVSGGSKGLVLPPDFKEQIYAWFAPASHYEQYGMSEMAGYARKCETGFYHWPPWTELLILDETGEELLPDEGRVTGRLALFDPLYSGRWGGVVSADKVNANFGRCTCGRPGPTIDDSITRFGADSPGGDDKLTCAAAVDAYVREAIE
jgi:hypothetical protein